MKRFFAIACVCMAGLSSAGAVEFIWGVSGAASAPSTLYAINPKNGAVLGTIGATGTVCLSGLAIQPGTGVLLAAQGQVNKSGASSKHFYRINKTTGVATAIGTLDPKYAISDIAMRADGTLFAFGIGGTVKKLLSINPANGTPTEIGMMNNITNVSLTFGSNNILYLVRTNGLFTVNPATGMMSALIAPITGATMGIDNMMATSSTGVVYAGLRSGNGTNLYTLNTTTGVTTLVGTAAGASLCGIVFDNASAPKVVVSGKKTLRTTKTTAVIKGKATSLLPLTVSAKGIKPVKVVKGKWTLKAKLRKGRNVINLLCKDGFAQSAKARLTIIRD
jgi:hypothetical protein